MSKKDPRLVDKIDVVATHYGTERRSMKITEFARCVSMIEGKKKEISIAQILEVLRIINMFSGGFLYFEIHQLKNADIISRFVKSKKH